LASDGPRVEYSEYLAVLALKLTPVLDFFFLKNDLALVQEIAQFVNGHGSGSFLSNKCY
jgi:hypothetical protein